MTASAWSAAALAGVAVLLLIPGRSRTPSVAVAGDGADRYLVAGCALIAAASVPLPWAPAAAVLAGLAAWWALGRHQRLALRRSHDQVAADLPILVLLLASGLRAGLPVDRALRLAGRALPGPAADRVGEVLSRIDLGQDPGRIWESLARDAELAPIGRALARAAETGAPVTGLVERLGADLDDASRAEQERRARSVGVRAAIPLGVCLLPAFVLLGVVPVAAGLFAGLLD